MSERNKNVHTGLYEENLFNDGTGQWGTDTYSKPTHEWVKYFLQRAHRSDSYTFVQIKEAFFEAYLAGKSRVCGRNNQGEQQKVEWQRE